MKNNIFIFYFFLALFFITNVFSKNLEINSSEIKIDKKESKIIFKGNIEAIDDNRNILKADEANYFKKLDLLNSIGLTKIITSENYIWKAQMLYLITKIK